MAKKYYKRKQEILALDFPSLGTAYANFGQFSLRDSEQSRTNYLDSTPERAKASASNNQDSFKGAAGLSFLSNLGPGINNFIDTQTTDERGIQSSQNAGISGGVRGGLNGLKMGLQTGNPYIAAGATILGAGIGIYKDIKQSNQQNSIAQDNLTKYSSQLPEASMTSANPYKISANGGFLANGGPMNENFNVYNGNSHEEGGLPIGQNNEVEGGEVNYKNYVFSDRLTPEDKKSTFANLAKRVRSKYKEREFDQAANRAMEQELTNLMQQNEQARIIKEAQDKHLQELENIKQKFVLGGPMKKSPGVFPNLDEDNSFASYQAGLNYLPTNTNVLPRQDAGRVDPNIQLPVSKEDLATPRASAKTGNKFKFGSEEAASGLAMLPAIYNNIKGAKPSKTVLDKAHPELINLEAERYNLKNEGAKARLIAGENIRNLGMGSGSSLAGLAAAHSAISSNVMEGLSRSYQNEANTNVGIKNQFNTMNTEIRNKEIVANEQNQAMSDSLKSLGLSDLSKNGQSYLKDKGLKKENLRSNEERTNLINQLFPNYKFGNDPETDKLVINYINTYYNGE